jgi:muramoyltetrapeptide carboxypeptidase LdcA involved in peptidoglycan recycling
MVQMIKPPRLQPGDTVAVVSPSWGGAGAFPHRVERGVECLQTLGFNVKLAPHALSQRGFVSDTPENRVADIHDSFRDPAVRSIVAAIGGDHSCHLLPLLDFDLIRANPKIFMGYSDVTVLNVAIWKATGLVTFNGPALLTDFAEYPQMFDYTREHLLRTVSVADPPGMIEPSPWWTEELLDWEHKADLERPRTRQPSDGWTWLKPGIAQGRLIGGCLESLQHLRGTRFWPGPDDWRGAIFFFETSEDKPSLATVDGMLMDYDNMGVLEQIGGMLVGRPMYYSNQEKEMLREVVTERTRRYSFPVVMDMDFGHTAPQFTLPLGCQARIDAGARRFEIVEAAVE